MYEVNMYNARRTLITLLLIGIFLTSCGGQIPESPTPDVNAILTAAIGTAAAAIFQTQTAIVPPATETFTPTAIPTNTPLTLSTATALQSATQPIIFNTLVPSFTPIPIVTGTQRTPTVNPTTLGVGCNNLRLIEDETIPAGTVLKPKETFTKSWKVENNGTCDWVYLYHFVFVSGESMGGGPERLGKVIPPGKWTQISLGLEAPKLEGTYTGTWRFADQDGNPFGSTLTVSIVVRK
ncbi:MAG: NBR1-Ig-like domain-containing protein [Anaerolineales bacterium]